MLIMAMMMGDKRECNEDDVVMEVVGMMVIVVMLQSQ